MFETVDTLCCWVWTFFKSHFPMWEDVIVKRNILFARIAVKLRSHQIFVDFLIFFVGLYKPIRVDVRQTANWLVGGLFERFVPQLPHHSQLIA